MNTHPWLVSINGILCIVALVLWFTHHELHHLIFAVWTNLIVNIYLVKDEIVEELQAERSNEHF